MYARFMLRLTIICISLFFLFGLPGEKIIAQDFFDDPLMLNPNDEFGFDQFGDGDFQDGSMGLPDGFQDFESRPLDAPLEPFSEQPQQGETYLDEGSFTDDTEAALRGDLIGRRELLQVERQQSTANLGYGAGTGLMIGTWFAFIGQESNTRNQYRTIGSSIVLGGVVGIMLGTRSVWNPGAPRAGDTAVKLFDLSKFKFQIAEANNGFKFAYHWKF